MENPLKAVAELQEALSELAKREAQLAGIPDWMQELHEEHSAHQTEIAAIEAELDEAATERRAAEVEIADHQERLKGFQEQISRVRNQREYGALLQEIDAAKNHISESEERALAALEKQEEGQGRLDAEKEASRDVDERYAEALEKWEAQKPDISRQAEEYRQRVAELEATMPANLLTTFQRILERHQGQALAPIRKIERGGRGQQMWHCGLCNYRVRPQAIVEISDRGGVVFCDSCKRILFLDQDAG